MARHYVYCREDGPPRRLALLDGPFATLDEAHASVPAAANWARDRAYAAPWWEYGAVTYHDDEREIPTPLMRRGDPRPEPPRPRREVVAYAHQPSPYARLTEAVLA